MQLRSKLALATLAGLLALPSLFAQDSAEGPGGTGNTGSTDSQDGPPAQQRLRRGPDGGPDGGREGGRRGGWQRGEGRGHGGGFHGMRGGRRGRGEFAIARLAENPATREKLGITAEQAAKISQQTSEFRKTGIRSHADLQVKRLELRDLMRADAPDPAAIDRKIDEIGAARQAQAKAEVHYRLAMREALTPEQRQKLEQMRAERRGGGPDGRTPRGPRPPRAPAPNS